MGQEVETQNGMSMNAHVEKELFVRNMIIYQVFGSMTFIYAVQNVAKSTN